MGRRPRHVLRIPRGAREHRANDVAARADVHELWVVTTDDTTGEVLGTDDARLPTDHFPVVADVTFEAP